MTEDADLGIRSAALGETVGVISSTTYEEANNAYGNFVRQRSRWIKGYLQTTLVHLRHPVELVRTAGWTKTLGFALLVGGTPLSFLFVPPLYLLFAVTHDHRAESVSPVLPRLGPVGERRLSDRRQRHDDLRLDDGCFKRRRYRLVMWALANPLYWLLHSLAAYKALWQLIVKPHYWEKTEHGLSDHVAARPGVS